MDMNTFQAAAVATAIYQPSQAVIYPALGLAGETGEVVEKIKKVIRDDGGFITEERKAAIQKEMGDVLWYLAALARDLEVNLADVAQGVLDKLASRAARGVLQGSGDNR